MKFPQKYEWLASLGTLPRMVTEALKEHGTLEVPGGGNNAKIMGWAKEVGLKSVYTADSVPWCGLFMRVIAQRAGKPWGKENSLWALNWAKFGTPAGQPCLGDVLVFTRTSGGHVGIYIAEDKNYYHVLGGNQSDSVSIARIEKKRLFAARRPKVWFRAPASARPYVVTTGGAITTNEQ